MFHTAHNRGSVSYTCRQTPEETCDDGRTQQFVITINRIQVCPVNICPSTVSPCFSANVWIVAEKLSHDLYLVSSLIDVLIANFSTWNSLDCAVYHHVQVINGKLIK